MECSRGHFILCGGRRINILSPAGCLAQGLHPRIFLDCGCSAVLRGVPEPATDLRTFRELAEGMWRQGFGHCSASRRRDILRGLSTYVLWGVLRCTACLLEVTNELRPVYPALLNSHTEGRRVCDSQAHAVVARVVYINARPDIS